ncbi:retrovirus-related pol polyprotein from transposon TNT 1-94, partial [Tanacetum coccineum]
QDDEVLNDDQSERSNHNNDNHIIDNLPNTKDIQTSEPLSSPYEDASDKHIELVNIIGDPGARMLTRAMAKELSAASAHNHPGWVDAMQEELNQFARNKVWTLVPAPDGKTIIGLKWVFRNKKDKT